VIEALNSKGLPERVVVDFTNETSALLPWRINAGIRFEFDTSGSPSAFRFVFPELLPAIAFIYCDAVGGKFMECGSNAIHENLQVFLDSASVCIQEYKAIGFASAIRASYANAGITALAFPKVAFDAYDLLTKHIAYHEVGHVYAQLTRTQEQNPVRATAFEIIADLLAVQWMYRKMIVNTPDTEEYRTFRGLASHSEALFQNCLAWQRSHYSLLCLMALAGAQNNGGRLTLDGGISHPPGLQRFMLQHVHFMTLVESNFSNILSVKQFEMLNNDWDCAIAIFIGVGLLPPSDIETYLDPRECDTLEMAANVIDERNISDLASVVPFLRGIRDISVAVLERAPKAAKGR
jgi:hypothetical protein